jgi:hypothetical protein
MLSLNGAVSVSLKPPWDFIQPTRRCGAPESSYGSMDIGPTLITASAPFPEPAGSCVVLDCIVSRVRVHCGGDGGGSDIIGGGGVVVVVGLELEVEMGHR